MSPQLDWRRVRKIFESALELDAEERPSFLAEACQGDPTLRRRVESLLLHDGEDGDPVSHTLREVRALSILRRPDDAGEPVIARYQLVRPLGEGGMGEVFEANQLEPVKRRVALKVIRRDMDSVDVVERFESERQALAMMSHVAIARLLDAGTTESGLPFFAMERIDGPPITDFCEAEELDLRSRLLLFCQVCEGIHYAHQKGVIHGDIKPSNVLIALDEGAQPKIIDFGVSHLAEGAACRSWRLAGTPEYMSPEQAGIEGIDVDIRADIYSLGVLLYELLTDHRPLDVPDAREVGSDEARRIILEVVPPPPSVRVSNGGSGNRRRARRLRGDLDRITMRALEKDRSRRYMSAWGLAADVRRYLASEPVSVGPPGLAYRVGKLIRRHRAAAIAFLSIVVASMLLAVLIFQNLASARARALQEQEEVWQARADLIGVLVPSADHEVPAALAAYREETVADLLRRAQAAATNDDMAAAEVLIIASIAIASTTSRAELASSLEEYERALLRAGRTDEAQAIARHLAVLRR